MLTPDQVYPQMPAKIEWKSLSEDLHTVAEPIEQDIRQFWSHLDAFYAALSVFENACFQMAAHPNPEVAPELVEHLRKLVGNWRFVACRDAAMTIYHFGKSLEAIRDEVFKRQMLSHLVNRSLVREAAQKYEKYFPNAYKMRHAVAHSAEISATKALRDQNAAQDTDTTISGLRVVAKDGGMISMNKSLIGASYTMSIEGTLVSYELTIDSMYKLVEVYRTFISAFSFLKLAG